MKNSLVIVESPAKARTLSQILGKDYVIKASMGHVRDLPKSTLGIEITDDFTPKYSVITERRKLISEIKKDAENAGAIYLATDPDREGEAISWHLIEAAKLNAGGKPLHRVVFHEITEDAVKKAFRNPRSLDMDMVNAQQARRVLDRLVGYKLSPFLWKKVLRGLSAGRVQSAAVRIVVDREREILDFKPIEYWTIEVELNKENAKSSNNFRASFVGLPDGKKIAITNKKESDSIINVLKKSAYAVKSVQSKTTKKQPAAPFITSTMQQEAWRKFHFTAKRTMAIAQQLYEGVALGEEGTVGLITYMRTDSTHLAPSAVEETRDFISRKYGEDYVPAKPRVFVKKAKFSQEAHEAIRPTKTSREPDIIHQYLKPEQNKLYELIWKRMVACQMSDAIYDINTIEILSRAKIETTAYLFRTSSSKLKFPGFTAIYSEGKDEEEKEDNAFIPKLAEGESLALVDVISEQNFTEPPSRYNEATLIKALEQKGIGRPSTYAPIISTIQDREYVVKEGGRFKPGEIGFVVNDLLVKNFPKIVDLNFTAKIEDDLDKVATGKKDWVSIVRDFYKPFEETLEKATATVERVNTDQVSDQVCPECGKQMLIKHGRFGKFLACPGYPECKKTMPILNKIGVPCPECGESDKGEVVQRRSKKRTIFYGCSRYPQCHFTTRFKPTARRCPDCGKMLVEYRKGGVKCIECNYKADAETAEVISST